MTTPKLELIGLTKAFGTKQVLRGVNLRVEAGQSLVIIGGSGTGKSVMIKCILGLLRPDAGDVRVDGQSVLGLTGKARQQFLMRIGMLFQGAALFDSLPIWRNVAFGLIQGRGMAARTARRLAIETLERVGLGADVADLFPPNCRAACRSGSGWRVRSLPSRRSSSSMSRRPASTRSWPMSSTR
ncbi:ABC transporter ATP-binding protein [Hankyongella ginsenosidimutans]|uniref:ABC transporter ATP-binding protein n=1 Tax=Hankyongella ginsenosidimutans TaxID=1763828 RepID=UPI00319EA874